MLGILGAVTLGVAVLSVYVSYQILAPRFGAWAAPTVGALDALWVVFQATEVLAGNHRARVRRVQAAGLALTAVNAAIPTVDLILTGGFDLAVVLTPIAIVATKTAWWIALPSLGRKVSGATQRSIAEKRQTVSDRLEEMEAEAAHRIEMLELATTLEQRVAKAETAYRVSVLEAQQEMTSDLATQAEATAATVAEMVLPASVAAICLPELGQWAPVAPALPGTAVRDGQEGMSVAALSGGCDASGTVADASHAGQGGVLGHRDVRGHAGCDEKRVAVTLEDLAAVAGVSTPEPGEHLTDRQVDVVLRHLRYRDDPPLSYRQAVATFRESGFVGSEKRVRRAWGALLSIEESDQAQEATEAEEESEGAGA
ncbi:hypothetical protein [Streptomyces sp. NPDC055709]